MQRGSSPRVRGKLPGRDPHSTRARLIPARAGKTNFRLVGGGRFRAHPRACGENQDFSILQIARLGSSPRVRGKHEYRRGYRVGHRLIPARAGKTDPLRGSGSASPAHPRACGENLVASKGRRVCPGSSPRVRGKLYNDVAIVAQARLIPARAGKTYCLKDDSAFRPAHPRACGENTGAGIRDFGLTGSSPRVRGKLLELGAEDRAHGLIPARAGKTAHAIRTLSAREAHPRACGENPEEVLDLKWEAGSSPRVRGKPQHMAFVRTQ